MNKRGLMKAGAISLVLIIVATSFLIIHSSNISSAIILQDTYNLGDKVRINLEGKENYKLTIKGPSFKEIKEGSNGVLIYKPEEIGEYKLQLEIGLERETYQFTVVSKSEIITEPDFKPEPESNPEPYTETGPIKEPEKSEDTQIEINKPVFWRQVEEISSGTKAKIKIPIQAYDISVYKEDTKIEPEIETNPVSNTIKRIISLNKNHGDKTITLETDGRISLEYYTDPPIATEKTINEKQKEITVSSPAGLHYENVKSYTTVKEVKRPEFISIYWKEEDLHLGFNAKDINKDGKLESIDWTIPHLSDQTFIITINEREDGIVDFLFDSENTFNITNRIWFNLRNLGNYRITITSPSQATYNRVGSNDFFIYDPSEIGEYGIELWRGNARSTHSFTVIDPNAPEPDPEPNPEPEPEPDPDEDENEDIVVTEIRHNPASVNEPVKWSGIVETKTLQVPENTPFTIQTLNSGGLIDYTVTVENSTQIIEIEEPVIEKIIIQYETPAPTLAEEIISPTEKQVIVSSPDEYQYNDVKTNVHVTEKVREKEKYKIFWVEEQKYIQFQAKDTNGNGLIDELEWYVPHLSTQTFIIIEITKADHLDENRIFIEDVFDLVKAKDNNWTEEIPVNHYIRVVFEKNLSAINDITLYARSNHTNATVEVYEFNQTTVLATFDTIEEDDFYQIFLSNLSNNTQDTFDLKIINAPIEFDLIIDPNITADTDLAGDLAFAAIDNTTFAVVWADGANTDAFLQFYNANGTNRTDVITVATNLEVEANDRARVSIDAINETTVLVAWADEGTGTEGAGEDVHVAMYDTEGNLKHGPVLVDDDVGHTNTVVRADVSVVSLSDRYVVCHIDDQSNDADAEVYTYANPTVSTGEDTIDSGIGPANDRPRNYGECATINDTSYTFVYYDDGTGDCSNGGNDIVFDLVDATSGVYDDCNVVDGDVGTGGAASVATTTLDNGNFALIWTDGSGGDSDTVQLAIYDDSGTAVLGETTIHSGRGNDEQAKLAMATVTNPDDTDQAYFIASWYDSGDNNVYGILFNSTGSNQTSEFTLADDIDTTYDLIDIYANDQYSGTSLCEGYFVFGYTNATSQDFVIRTFNITGAEWDGNCDPDLTPPEVTIVFPQNTTHTSLPLEFNVTLNEPGDTVTFTLDGGINTYTMSTTDNINYNFTNTSIESTSFTFEVTAKDIVGNTNDTESVAFTINLPPNITLNAPANDTLTNNPTQNLSANVSDDVGLANATLFVYNETDDLINQTTVSVSGTEAVVGIVYTFLYDGVFKWFYNVVDTISNSFGALSNFTITVDTSNPNVTIRFPDNLSYIDLPLNFNVSLIETGSAFYTLDGGINNVTMTGDLGFTGTEFNATNTSIALGTYTFTLYANDTAGNNNYTETVVFTVSQVGNITIDLIDPNANRSVNPGEFFNFTAQINCVNGECGNLNVTLDPASSWWNNSYEYRKQLNITVGDIEPYNNYSGYTVQLITNTSTLVSGGKMQSDLDDLRIVYYNGSDNIELDRLTFNNNTVSTYIRFQLQANISESSSDENYYMYYGLSSASNPPENQSNVYLWYDNASTDREAAYTQGRVDESGHGGGFANSVAHNAAGYYDFDTGDNAADSLRPTGLSERDVYVEYEEYQTDAYPTDMTSCPLTRWEGTGSGSSETSSHWYCYEMADSAYEAGSYAAHDDITADTRAAVIIANGALGTFPQTSYTRVGLASWNINPTNLSAFYDASPDANESGSFGVAARFSGSHASGSDNENSGEIGVWLQQDAGRIRNLLIRRYTDPEPTVAELTEEKNLKGLVSTTAGDTPFYTIHANPMHYLNTSCLENMGSGQSCNVTWTVNATGNTGSSWEFFVSANGSNYTIYNESIRINITIENIAPTTPELDLPVNDSAFNVFTEFNWSNSTDATRDPITYILQISNQSDFTSFSYVNNTISETEEPTGDTPSGITQDNLYYWRVFATDGKANSSSSEVRQFYYDTTAPVITLNSPENNSLNTTSNILDFSYNVSDLSNVTSCSLIINGGINATDTSITKNTPQNFQDTLPNGVYFWNVNCTDQVGQIGSSEIRTLNVSVSNNPPIAHEIECEEGGSFKQCSELGFGDVLTSVRLRCTDAENNVTNVTLNFTNIPDSNLIFENITMTNASNYWTFDNNDVTINDSGNFTIEAICRDTEGRSSINSSTWFVPWGNITIDLIDPLSNINVLRHSFFNFTAQINCLGGECSNINATLDPANWWNNSYEYRKQLNITVGDIEPYNNYSGYTVQLITNTSTLVSGGKMQSDLDDLRIVYYNGSDNIELDRVTIDNNTVSTQVRFRLQENISLSNSDTGYYIYYGLSSASNPPENQSNVYLWYDNASTDREAAYTQGRVDSTAHGGGFGNSFSHNAAGYYDFDTGDNAADSLRPTGLSERDVYVEYELYQTNAYDTEMTSGPITRWEGTGSGSSETSSHFYYYSFGDSDIDSSGPYAWHDDILADDRSSGAVIIANGGSEAFPTNSYTKMGIASWNINPTNLSAWYDESPDANESGSFGVAARFSGSHASGSDNENPGEIGMWLQQDAGRLRNLLIRRYTDPEPSVEEFVEETRQKGIISTTIGDTPFYTIHENPMTYQNTSCLTEMKGNSCNVTWSVNATGEASTTWTFFAFANNTNYTSLVNINNISDTINITIVAEIAPTTPQLNSPANNSAQATFTEFNWSNSTDANNDIITYYFQVDNNSDFSSPEYTNQTIAETESPTGDTPSGITAEGTYYWRVLATDGGLNSSWSETWIFHYDLTPPNLTFINQTGEDAEFINDTHFLDEGENITFFVNVSDTNVDNVWIVIWEGVKGGAELVRKAFTLVAGILYFAVVESDNTWNTLYNFTIFANDSLNQTSEFDSNISLLKGDITISLSPNPVSSSTNVTIFGHANLTNGSTLNNHPINIWLNDTLLLLANVTPEGTYDNHLNFNDTASNNFSTGTFHQTESIDTNISLSAGNTSGNFTKILDAGALVEWDNIVFIEHTDIACSALATFQDGDENNYNSTNDTYIRSSDTSANFGNSDTIIVDGSPTDRGIIQFGDIVGRDFNQIPENSTITAANITLEISDSGNIVTVYEVLEEWAETQATYNNRLTGTSWSSTGIGGSPSRSDTVEDTFTASSTGTYTFDITNAMNRWVNSTSTNYGVVLDMATSNGINIRSSDYSTQSERPKLTVQYSSSSCANILVYTRTSKDKETWTAWQQVNSGEGITDHNNQSRYLEYRVELSTTNSSFTPYLEEIYINYTAIVTNGSGDYRYNFTNPAEFGDYPMSVNTSLRTITIENNATLSVQTGVAPNLSLDSPADETWFSHSNVTLFYNATDANGDIVNATLIINGERNQTNQSEVLNGLLSNFTVNFTSGQWNWTVNITDSTGSNATDTERTFYIDLIDPNVTLVSPENSSNHFVSELNLSYNVTDNLASNLNCSVILDGSTISAGVGVENGAVTNTSSGTLTNGQHLWNVTCIDEASRSYTSETWQFNISDTPPTVELVWPVNAYVDSDGNITFVFNASDNNGFTNATLIINDSYDSTITSINNSFNTSITSNNLGEGNYNWTILVFDTSSLSAQAIHRNFTVDLFPPVINLNAPSNATPYSNSTVQFNFTVIDTVNTSLSCDLTVNGAILDTFSATNGTLTNREITSLTDEQKYWNVTCIDDASHSNTSVTWWVNITESPSVELNTANGLAFNSSTFNLTYTPHDNTNLSSCSLYINDVLNQTNSTQVINNQINNFTVVGSSEGSYNWTVSCTDFIGLTGQAVERNYSVDFAGPNVTLFNPNSEEIGTTNVTFNFTVLDDIDTSFLCNLTVDTTVVDINFTATNGTVEYRNISGITDGDHTWFVNCTDSAENIGNSPIYNFTKSTPPEVSLTNPSDQHWFNSGEFNLSYYPFDDEGFLEARLYINGSIQTTNSTEIISDQENNFTLTGFSNGNYTWTVQATDVRGLNATASPNRTFYVDLINPNLILNAPGNTTITTNNVTFNFTTSDNLDPLLECILLLDGESEYNDNSTSGSDVINNILIGDGSHQWNVTCIDEADNQNFSETVTFTVEAPPNVTLIELNESVIINTTETTFIYLPEDPLGITNCSIFINDQINQTDNSISANNLNNFTISGIPEGRHNWTVQCIDAAPDFNSFTPAARNFTLDRTPPSITLEAPPNNSNTLTDVDFNFSVIDALDVNEVLICDLYIDGTASITNINVPNGTIANHTATALSPGTHVWNVTCVDDGVNSNWSETWHFNVTFSDLTLNSSDIVFNNSNPQENETITINATIHNVANVVVKNVTVQFFDGDPDTTGIQIGSNQTISQINGDSNFTTSVEWQTDLGTSDIYVVVDPPLSINGSIAEWDETNNKANNSIAVGAWQFVYGEIDANSEFDLEDLDNNSVIKWESVNFDEGNIYVTDADSTISWDDLYAVGKTTAGANETNDFAEIDDLLNLTSFVDSITELYTIGGNVALTQSYYIFNRNIVEIPLTNSTNNTNFLTGILWDSSDDLGGGNFNETDKEDLIFFTRVNKDQPGAYGTYDYEIRIPAPLRSYIITNPTDVVFFTEIR